MIKRYNAVEKLDFGMERTLSRSITDILQKAALWGYDTAQQLLVDLQTCAVQHGWDFEHAHPNPPAREARRQMRAGLIALRRAQEQIDHYYTCRRQRPHPRTLERFGYTPRYSPLR